jgi:hypothetical protein
MGYKDRARKRAAERSDGVYLRLKEGDTTFRILPTPDSSEGAEDGMFIEYGVHRDVGPKKEIVRCGKSIPEGTGRCWLCDEQIPKLRKKGNVTRAKAMEPRDVFLLQVAKVNEDGSMIGPKIFTPSKTVADQIMTSIFGSKKKTYEDPKKGYNLTINRVGTGKNDTRYGIIEPDEESTVVPAELMKKLKPFNELKEIPAYDEAKQKAAYVGQDAIEDPDDEDDEDDDVEVEETPKKPSKPAAKKPAVVEDDEDDDEDEAPAKPAPKASKKPPVIDDEEDDDDLPPVKTTAKKPVVDDEDDEDDDLPPVKPAAKKAVVIDDDDEPDVDIEDDEDDEDSPPPPKKKK